MLLFFLKSCVVLGGLIVLFLGIGVSDDAICAGGGLELLGGLFLIAAGALIIYTGWVEIDRLVEMGRLRF